MLRVESFAASKRVCWSSEARRANASALSERKCSRSSVSFEACVASVPYLWIKGFRSIPKASLITPPYRSGNRLPFAEFLRSISSAAERRPRLRRSVLSSSPLARSEREAFDGNTTVSVSLCLPWISRSFRGRKLMSAVRTARSLVVRPSSFLSTRTGLRSS